MKGEVVVSVDSTGIQTNGEKKEQLPSPKQSITNWHTGEKKMRFVMRDRLCSFWVVPSLNTFIYWGTHVH